MSITDIIPVKPHIEVATNILNIQKLAINIASFGVKQRIKICHEHVDDFTLDYLSAKFDTSIIKSINKSEYPYIIIRSDAADIYVHLKQ